ITFPSEIAPGTWRLRLAFTGILNDKLRGFYRSSYKDPTGEGRLMAATQFEATDARRAFPCWDEPAFKAVFAVTLVIDPKLTAVSNTSIVGERVERGRKVVTFADTMKMSTYLVAFVVGELEATDAVLVGRTPVRVWCVPGKRHLAAFGHEIGVASLRFFEDYYGLPYPSDKLDLLAIPDFAAGAMENLGAITFRQTALLVDARAAPHTELERVADVVAHQNTHLGFGDIVREYLRRHGYDNAETGDLWAALGRAAKQPIPEVMDAWVFQPGYPLVSARVEGNQLVLSQQRFTYLPEPLPGSTPTPLNQ